MNFLEKLILEWHGHWGTFGALMLVFFLVLLILKKDL